MLKVSIVPASNVLDKSTYFLAHAASIVMNWPRTHRTSLVDFLPFVHFCPGYLPDSPSLACIIEKSREWPGDETTQQRTSLSRLIYFPIIYTIICIKIITYIDLPHHCTLIQQKSYIIAYNNIILISIGLIS